MMIFAQQYVISRVFTNNVAIPVVVTV